MQFFASIFSNDCLGLYWGKEILSYPTLVGREDHQEEGEESEEQSEQNGEEEVGEGREGERRSSSQEEEIKGCEEK